MSKEKPKRFMGPTDLSPMSCLISLNNPREEATEEKVTKLNYKRKFLQKEINYLLNGKGIPTN